jgi:hypothetical protein
MRNVEASPTFPLLRMSGLVTGLIIACLRLASPAPAQAQSPLARIEALGLESMKVGRVTTLCAPNDRARAKELAELSEAAAAVFERALGVSFEFRLAALGPNQWFSTAGGPGMPYGIPWALTAERLMVVPASLREGVLINGTDAVADRRRVDFVTLHEFGHLIAKQYLHPTSAHEELPILWFEEIVATYFGYAFVSSIDRDWAEASRREWMADVAGYTPRTRSLDWSFMRGLPPAELASTYGWYQVVLNLRVADIYATHGLGFLRALKENLPFHSMNTWTTESLLADLERITPGFQRWADEFQKGANHPRPGINGPAVGGLPSQSRRLGVR